MLLLVEDDDNATCKSKLFQFSVTLLLVDRSVFAFTAGSILSYPALNKRDNHASAPQQVHWHFLGRNKSACSKAWHSMQGLM